jgi:hypothetical protein
MLINLKLLYSIKEIKSGLSLISEKAESGKSFTMIKGLGI